MVIALLTHIPSPPILLVLPAPLYGRPNIRRFGIPRRGGDPDSNGPTTRRRRGRGADPRRARIGGRISGQGRERGRPVCGTASRCFAEVSEESTRGEGQSLRKRRARGVVPTAAFWRFGDQCESEGPGRRKRKDESGPG